jgi:hypothetical protein
VKAESRVYRGTPDEDARSPPFCGAYGNGDITAACDPQIIECVNSLATRRSSRSLACSHPLPLSRSRWAKLGPFSTASKPIAARAKRQLFDAAVRQRQCRVLFHKRPPMIRTLFSRKARLPGTHLFWLSMRFGQENANGSANLLPGQNTITSRCTPRSEPRTAATRWCDNSFRSPVKGQDDRTKLSASIAPAPMG